MSKQLTVRLSLNDIRLMENVCKTPLDFRSLPVDYDMKGLIPVKDLGITSLKLVRFAIKYCENIESDVEIDRLPVEFRGNKANDSCKTGSIFLSDIDVRRLYNIKMKQNWLNKPLVNVILWCLRVTQKELCDNETLLDLLRLEGDKVIADEFMFEMTQELKEIAQVTDRTVEDLIREAVKLYVKTYLNQ